MTKQKILKIDNSYGWKTKYQFRLSMNDLIIEQSNRKMKEYRFIYLDNDDLIKLKNFINNIRVDKNDRK